MPYLIPSGVLAAPGGRGPTTGSASPASASAGRAAASWPRRCRLPARALIGVADVNLPRAEATAKKHGGVAVQDYRKMLDRKDVDAIITATPEHWRAMICIHACQAGKDIYAEKPVSLTIREGRLMVQAVRKYQRVFQVGSQQRSMAVDRGLRVHSRAAGWARSQGQ